MKKNQFSHSRPHFAYLFAGYGLALGVVFVIGCTFAQSWVQFSSISLVSLFRTQAQLPWFWTIDVLPFLLALGAFYRGQHEDLVGQSRAERQVFIEELERRNIQLDKKVKAQTEALQSAFSKLERAYAAKSEFLAMVSHELRTPVTGLMGFLELLKDTDLSLPQADYVDTAHHSGEHLLTLLNNILDFSKIESGHLELESTDFEVRTLVEDVTDILAPIAVGKDVELTLLVSAGVPQMLKGDPTRLRQILINLINNAIKFTENGEIVIQILLEDLSAQGAKVRFEVRDTGCGIDLDVQSRIFDSFTQAQGSTARYFGGTGLGLSIAKQLTELMGGQIGLSSKPAIGSTFWFSVLMPISKLEPRPFPPIADLAGKRALLLMTRPNGKHDMQQQLTQMGLEVVSVEDQLAATVAIEQANAGGTDFDLVLIDGPGHQQDMLSAASITRLCSPETKLIKLAGFGKRGDARAASQAGFHAYLSKPVGRQQLRDCVLSVLQRSENRPEQMVTKHRLAESEAQNERCILLVEDNEINQKVTQAMLKKLGYRVDVAKNGKEALASLEHNQYELVLMDCYMPVMDGFETTREIRRRDCGQHLPIIAASGLASEEEIQKCLASGMNACLRKPVKQQALESCLDKWLEKGKRA
jgi:two-component system, sensor histidine kinase and response regulator